MNSWKNPFRNLWRNSFGNPPQMPDRKSPQILAKIAPEDSSSNPRLNSLKDYYRNSCDFSRDLKYQQIFLLRFVQEFLMGLPQ